MSLIVGTTAIWISHHYISQQQEEKFIARYSAFSGVLAGSLNQLDIKTESLMLNAAKVVAAKEAEKGLLSDNSLKELRDELNVSHIFVIDKNGKFIRSTNEEASLIPNLYSFCGDYENLVLGKSLKEATPVIKPDPEPNPHKFLLIPNYSKNRIIEVGMRVDFIAQTLSSALSEDQGIVAISLFDPKGNAFGTFKSSGVKFKNKPEILPQDFSKIVQSEDSYKFYSKVAASHKVCCQCDVSGVSNNGEYYYILETEVSKKELLATRAKTNLLFAILSFIILIVSLALSRFLSKKLMCSVKKAVDKVRRIKDSGTDGERINSQSQDEISYLTEEFDKLLDKLEDTKKKELENEAMAVKIQMAREIAHNIKSPIVALEMMIPFMVKMPDEMKKVLKNSINEIKNLSQKLKTQAEIDSISNKPELLYLPFILKEIVERKRIEYSSRKEIGIEFINNVDGKDAFIKGNSTELKSILSNIINNAVESYSSHGGIVKVILDGNGFESIIRVEDQGIGIPAEYLKDMGEKQISFKGDKNRGLGLTHAYRTIESWGGQISIHSKVGEGTSMMLQLSKSKNRQYVNGQ